MSNISIFQTTPDEIAEAIAKSVKTQLDELKKNWQPKEPTEYLTRNEVAEMLSIDLSSVHNWTKKGIITAYQISGRVYYKRKQIENALIELKQK
ncbi:helix-turn-helix domain-containing protein [Kordia sp.]|uniref:helix-turn-helix domain-containing protein n=1 Tax=Kordia sp. TaxID=1965332 RepID=UPI003D2D9F3E